MRKLASVLRQSSLVILVALGTILVGFLSSPPERPID